MEHTTDIEHHTFVAAQDAGGWIQRGETLTETLAVNVYKAATRAKFG